MQNRKQNLQRAVKGELRNKRAFEINHVSPLSMLLPTLHSPVFVPLPLQQQKGIRQFVFFNRHKGLMKPILRLKDTMQQGNFDNSKKICSVRV